MLLNKVVSQQELATLKADMESKEAIVKSKLLFRSKSYNYTVFGVLGVFHIQVGDYVKAGYQLPESFYLN
ncbi:MAG: hypothetical protein AB8V48_00470 [Coxiella endosymbiont of Dermacentor nuttalli]